MHACMHSIRDISCSVDTHTYSVTAWCRAPQYLRLLSGSEGNNDTKDLPPCEFVSSWSKTHQDSYPMPFSSEPFWRPASDGSHCISATNTEHLAKQHIYRYLSTVNNHICASVGKLSLELKKKIIKCLVCSIVLYAADTWMLMQADRSRLEALEMWIWRRWRKSVVRTRRQMRKFHIWSKETERF